MKTKRFSVFLAAALAVVMLISFTSCSEGTADMDYSMGGETVETTPDKGALGDSVLPDRKIITTVDMTVETKDYTRLVDLINSSVESSGGYIQKADEYSYSGDLRRMEITLRIPAADSSDFIAAVETAATVTSKSIGSDDITTQYVDIESRLSALNAERVKLEELIAAAETLSDVITIQERLTDVIYEIESIESQLRAYDNLVEYTTVTMTLREVERETVVEEMTMWEEIGHNLVVNTEGVLDFCRSAFVGIVSLLPLLIPVAIIAAVVLIIVFAVKKLSRKSRNKK